MKQKKNKQNLLVRQLYGCETLLLSLLRYSSVGMRERLVKKILPVVLDTITPKVLKASTYDTCIPTYFGRWRAG